MSSATTPKVGVLVLNWNGRQLLEDFAPSWVAHTPDYAELVIIDNGSTDESLSFLQSVYPEVKVLAFDENYGFAEGYNRAIAGLDYPYVVLLNSDAALSEGWLDQALQLLETEPELGAVQPKIRALRAPEAFEYAGAAGGYIDALGYPFCRGRLLDTVEVDEGQYDEPSELLWASGACLIVRRSVYLELGGLDTRFFAHQEEIDLCWRLNARGASRQRARGRSSSTSATTSSCSTRTSPRRASTSSSCCASSSTPWQHSSTSCRDEGATR